MLLVQETRDELGRALRGGPTEGELDFCSAGGCRTRQRPARLRQRRPADGLRPGGAARERRCQRAAVTPSGGTTARALGEHLATLVNVRDFGAIGDGVTDDAAAFAGRDPRRADPLKPGLRARQPDRLCAGHNPDARRHRPARRRRRLDAQARACQRLGAPAHGHRRAHRRTAPAGAGVNGMPSSPADVDLDRRLPGRDHRRRRAPKVPSCTVSRSSAASRSCDRGRGRGDRRLPLLFNRTGMELRAGAQARSCRTCRLHACTSGHPGRRWRAFDQLTLARRPSCRPAVARSSWTGPPMRWRGVELSDLHLRRQSRSRHRGRPASIGRSARLPPRRQRQARRRGGRSAGVRRDRRCARI